MQRRDPPSSSSSASLPTLLVGAILCLVALEQPWVAMGGGLGAVVWYSGLREWIDGPTVLWVPLLAAAGGAAAAFAVGTELRPSGAGVANAMRMLRHVGLAGGVFGGAMVGVGALFLVRGAGRGAGSEPPPRWLGRSAAVLKPFRLVGLIGVAAYAPVLSTTLGGGAADARREMTEALRQAAYHQESHHRATGAFTDALGRVPGYRHPPDAEVRVLHADAERWRALATHPRVTTRCFMEGSSRAGVPVEPSPPRCEEDPQWF